MVKSGNSFSGNIKTTPQKVTGVTSSGKRREVSFESGMVANFGENRNHVLVTKESKTQVAIKLQSHIQEASLRVVGKYSEDEIHEQVVRMTIFNHGVNETREFFGLPAPRITSIFFRTDCWERCLIAAKQMIAKGKGK